MVFMNSHIVSMKLHEHNLFAATPQAVVHFQKSRPWTLMGR